MFSSFDFNLGTRIIYGTGSIKDVGTVAKELGGKKIMIVADKGVRNTGITDNITSYLSEEKIDIIDFDKIVPNPRISDCEEGAKIAAKEKIDLIVAVGGGSSMDTAKAIAGMYGHNTTNFDDIKYPFEYTNDPCPLIAIPTTAGTGSEVTICGVITNEKTHLKEFCFDYKCAPTIAIADPELLMGLPKEIAAATGIDALTHAIEGYVANCTNTITEAYGLYAIKLIHNHIRKYVYKRDIESCEAMMIGSLLAGLSFGYSDTCSVHSLSETIGGLYDTPHGVANAIFLGPVTELSIAADVPKYSDIAVAMGIKNSNLSDRELAQAGVDEIKTLVKDLEIPKFSEIDGVDPKDFDLIAERCEVHMSNADNPVFITKERFIKLLNDVYES